MFDLKLFRTTNKLTQVQLAEYFGVTQAYVSQIERGLLDLPTEYISKIKADNLYRIPNDEKKENSDVSKSNNSLEILAKAIETLSESEKTNTKNIQELIAQGREQTNNITKLVDLLCRSGIIPDNISAEEKREQYSENDTDENTAYNAGSANVG